MGGDSVTQVNALGVIPPPQIPRLQRPDSSLLCSGDSFQRRPHQFTDVHPFNLPILDAGGGTPHRTPLMKSGLIRGAPECASRFIKAPDLALATATSGQLPVGASSLTLDRPPASRCVAALPR